MRKPGLNLLFAIACFTFGIGCSNFEFFEVFQGPIPPSHELPVSLSHIRFGDELTFQDYGGIADGRDENGNYATFTSSQASDGLIINSTLIYRIPSKRQLLKIFNKRIANADSIISREPYRNYWKREIGQTAFVREGENFSLLKFVYCKSDCSMIVLESSSLKHILEFDRQAQARLTSEYVNQLRP